MLVAMNVRNTVRRFQAAACDAAVLAVGCVVLFQAFRPHAPGLPVWAWGPAAAVVALQMAAEVLTGLTPGKGLLGLAVRLPDGTPPPLWRLAVRGATRLAPVALVLLGLLVVADPLVNLVVCYLAAAVAICYIPMCYIQLMRTGVSVFDVAGGTVVVERGAAGRGAGPGSSDPLAGTAEHFRQSAGGGDSYHAR